MLPTSFYDRLDPTIDQLRTTMGASWPIYTEHTLTFLGATLNKKYSTYIYIYIDLYIHIHIYIYGFKMFFLYIYIYECSDREVFRD